MDNPELTKEQRLDIEEKAIQALLQMGVRFNVPLKIEPKKPSKRFLAMKRIFAKRDKVWRDKRIPKGWEVDVIETPDLETKAMKPMYVRKFHIKPLYLGTIDRLRQLYIEIEYNEDDLQNDPIRESKRLFKYTSLMAKIAAIATINTPAVADDKSKEVEELTRFYMEHLTVARLQKLAEVIAQMMNPAGFTSSIRLIREVGTTRPKTDNERIER